MGQTGIGPVQRPGLLQLSHGKTGDRGLFKPHEAEFSSSEPRLQGSRVYPGRPTNGFQPVGMLDSRLLSPVNAAVAQVMVCSGS